jgi:hypothetical protein
VAVFILTPAHAQDSYLDMLDAYSDDVTDIAPGSGSGKDQKNDRGAFESQLRRNFKGSYVLYAKLSETDKEKVFNNFQETGKVSGTRSLIVRLYSNR